MITLYKNIRKRRRELDITQAELAEAVGYTDKSMISLIEHGKIDLPISKLMAIAEVLGVPAGDLIGEDGIAPGEDPNGKA